MSKDASRRVWHAGAVVVAVACAAASTSCSDEVGEAGATGSGSGAGGGGLACAEPPPGAELAVSTHGGVDVSTADFWVVLTGTLPDLIDGSPIGRVEVDGSPRGVRFDANRHVWSYLLAHEAGEIDVMVTAIAESGAMAGPVAIHHSVGSGRQLPARDLGAGAHTVGAWMFSWFTGQGSGWECNSPWQPAVGFDSWDGSTGWARTQLIDQLDAGLDLVGLQLDTIDSASYRWQNVVNVVKAAAELFAEGYEPPRLFPFVDTAIVADNYAQQFGGTLDLATGGGRDHLYGFFAAFQNAMQSELGDRYLAAAQARYEGRPYLSMWHSVTIDGESEAAVVELKTRFASDFAATPYFVAHPNDWRNFPAIDEVTLMVGPPAHFYTGGRDATGAATVNIEAGFWNPTSNPFYLPREAGAHFDAAWASALAVRSASYHLYIDTWNETGEGSGIFEAQPTSYSSSDTGPCGSFVNLHDEAWGPTARHYIDRTRAEASSYNDALDLDAAVVAHDLPTTLRPGERRWATVVFRNRGDATWPTAGSVGLVARTGSASFGLGAPVPPLSNPGAPTGGITRGAPGIFVVLLTGPCEPGVQPLALGLADGPIAFGDDVTWQVIVAAP